ncbi:Hsp20/alpha crystallin family protein [Meridianimarinicoccus aquatilis]|uniref:Hsp20/alpha crystallin family protein n=1 Tax=Meridianimarinicoccus aquatilis TaxID=2552766 RepID=A0A4R6AS53_9RHOB|nr:Hsp20/alpha crystallin family protein [Fluviibacterium aquatile]TDL86950.1 Hsp20/alpha crystallin family protein [Fluviibacterium aquatile]
MDELTEDGGFWPSLYDRLKSPASAQQDWVSPLASACACDDFYRVTIEIPGVSIDDFIVEVRKNTIYIEGDKGSYSDTVPESIFFFNERRTGHFARSFNLPPDALLEEFKTVLKNGVLELWIPRSALGTDICCPESTTGL